VGLSGKVLHFDPFVLEFEIPAEFDGFTLRINMTDRSGRVGECRASYSVDSGSSRGPLVRITHPAEGAVLVDPETIAVRGTAQADVGSISEVILWAPGQPPITASGGESWTAQWDVPSLASGTYRIFAFAMDDAGRISPDHQVAVTIIRQRDGARSALLALMTISIDPATPMAGQAASVAAVVSNFGNASVEGLSYRMTITRLGGQTFDIVMIEGRLNGPIGGLQNVTFAESWNPQSPGNYKVLVELNTDASLPASVIVKGSGGIEVRVAGESQSLGTSLNPLVVGLLAVLVAAGVGIVLYRGGLQRDKERNWRKGHR
jgi:hypothetical protein